MNGYVLQDIGQHVADDLGGQVIAVFDLTDRDADTCTMQEAVVVFRRGDTFTPGDASFGHIRYCIHLGDESGSLFWGHYDIATQAEALRSGIDRAGLLEVAS